MSYCNQTEPGPEDYHSRSSMHNLILPYVSHILQYSLINPLRLIVSCAPVLPGLAD